MHTSRTVGAMQVSCQDVARAAGVSPATVSLVLNQRMNVSLAPATRRRVTEIATQLGYRPNHMARSLLRGRTQTIGLILPTLASSFVAQIAEGVQAAAGDEDHRVLLAHTRHDVAFEAAQFELLLQHKVDGILIVTGEKTLPQLPERIELLGKCGVPCVVIDDRSLVDRVDCVVSDDEQGAALAVKHLMAAGHRRIGFLGAGALTSSARDRLAGYRSALRQARIGFDESLVIGDSFLGGDGLEAMKALLSRSDRPSAVFAANDRRLAEGLPALRALGLRVPEEVALAGYANYDFAAYLELTSVDQDAAGLGRCALRRLLERIANPELKPRLLKQPTRLVVRASSGRVR